MLRPRLTYRLAIVMTASALPALAQIEEPFGPACEQRNVAAECGTSLCCIANPRIKSAPATPVCTRTVDRPVQEGNGFCCNANPGYRTWIKDGKTGPQGEGYEVDPGDSTTKRNCPSGVCEDGYYFYNSECCALNGSVVDKNPVKDPKICPNLHERPNYVPSENGCGPKKFLGVPVPGFVTINIASYYRGETFTASFLMPCNFHDVCYGTCDPSGTKKSQCDDSIEQDLHAACDSAYNALSPSVKDSLEAGVDKVKCDHMANGYTKLVRNVGGAAWNSAQGDACDCC